ncbi:MAG: DUF4381 family protein [Verrucomicrobia bacterium]|nr:DUF4381 family protein [Verrucomicrobiota bacterium]
MLSIRFLSLRSLCSFAAILQPGSPAPLHDIVGPVPFFPYTTSQIVVAVAILFLLLGGLGYFIWRSRRKRPLTRREAMLQALAEMKKELMIGSDHDFGIRVSTLLRNYLGEVFGLAAPRQTTEEFLKSLQGQKRFSLAEQEALSDFLRQSDVLKFAQGVAEAEERLILIQAAEKFVQKGMEEEG